MIRTWQSVFGNLKFAGSVSTLRRPTLEEHRGMELQSPTLEVHRGLCQQCVEPPASACSCAQCFGPVLDLRSVFVFHVRSLLVAASDIVLFSLAARSWSRTRWTVTSSTFLQNSRTFVVVVSHKKCNHSTLCRSAELEKHDPAPHMRPIVGSHVCSHNLFVKQTTLM